MKLLWGIAAVALLAAAWSGIGRYVWRQPEVTPAIRGEALARELGCFGCHGPGGLGGIADPTSSAGDIPGWRGATASMYVRNEQEIREWILYGAPRESLSPGQSTASHSLVPMPAYAEYLSSRELDDLVAYFRAVSGWAPEIPDNAYEGRKLASRLGCFGCHGPSGMGGVANPGSFVGHVPPWDGAEFEELVHDESELREWILDGRPRRLADNTLARFFLDRQKTPMPAYREHISDDDLKKLVAYIGWLRSR
ncbi:MAG: cytochrome c [Pirellulales bacterium]